jgi:hypothetical protein
MEYRTALFFLFLYYIRPQDWIPSLAGFNIVRPMILVWLVALYSGRERQKSPLSGLLKTPHDWILLAYFSYIIWNAEDSNGTFKALLPYAAFYMMTVQSLSSWERLLGYLKFWNLMLMGVALLAVGSLVGVDFTGAKDVTEANAGRLSINTWLHSNPNALAHSVVVAMALGYISYFWKGGGFGRLILYPLCAFLAGTCAYHTESKGSFLVAAGLIVLVFVVGRPRVVQAFVLAIAGTLGVGALKFLPRMQGLDNLEADEGVIGRLMAWFQAHEAMLQNSTGVGWRQFVAWITWEGDTLPKATHSSYVQVGADLGMYGLMLYIACLWCSARTTLSVHRFTQSVDDRERVRRCLFLLMAAYIVSNWMINREYHTEFFLMMAIAGATHRLCKAEEMEMERLAAEGVIEPLPNKKRLWNRLGVVDLAVSWAGLKAVLWFWERQLEKLP